MRDPKTTWTIAGWTLTVTALYAVFLTATATYSHYIYQNNAKLSTPEKILEDVAQSINNANIPQDQKESVLQAYVDCARETANGNGKALANKLTSEDAMCSMRAFDQAEMDGLHVDTSNIIFEWLKQPKFEYDTIMFTCYAHKGEVCDKIKALAK